MMAIYWRTQQTYRGFGYWALGSVGIALTFLLFAGKGILPEFYTVVVANTAAISAVVCRHVGVRFFWGQAQLARPVYHLIPIIACTLLLLYFTLINDDPLSRLIAVTACISVYTLLISRDMTKGGQQGYPIVARTIAFIYFLYAITMAGRLLEWSLYPEVRYLLISSTSSLLYFICLLVLEVSSALLFMMLNSQRLAKNLGIARQELEKLASLDSLTGLYNRRSLMEKGAEEIARSEKLQQPCSLLLIDLDRLKQTNDTHGHSAGDALLVNVVEAIRSQIHEGEIFGRLGGDEFVLLLPGATLATGQKKAEQLRQTVREHPFVWENKTISMSVSIGVSELTRFDAGWNDWLQRADLNLYQEKKKWLNKIC